MAGVGLEKLEVFVCEFLEGWGKLSVAFPEGRGGKVRYITLHFPALKSAIAWLAKESSLPEATSSSNC